MTDHQHFSYLTVFVVIVVVVRIRLEKKDSYIVIDWYVIITLNIHQFHLPSVLSFFFASYLLKWSDHLCYRVFCGLEFADCISKVSLNMFLFSAIISSEVVVRSKGLIRFRLNWQDYLPGDDCTSLRSSLCLFASICVMWSYW